MGDVGIPRRWTRALDLDEGLSVDRVRSRISAYVYGNILVLASVLTADQDGIRSGEALLVLLVTMATTYLAHVLAHDISERVDRTQVEHLSHRTELRDAVPIVSSAAWPALALGAAALGWLATAPAQGIAAAFVVLRLGALGWVVGRLSGEPAPRFSWWSGVALAGTGALIAGLKVVLLH